MSCRKARSFLSEAGAKFEEVNLSRGLSVAELEALIGDRDYQLFLNPRNELFKQRNMGERPPSRAEALELMSKNPNLVRRPILVKGRKVILGFQKPEWEQAAK